MVYLAGFVLFCILFFGAFVGSVITNLSKGDKNEN